MSTRSFTKAEDIDLSGTPWDVTDVEECWVLLSDGKLILHSDPSCQDKPHPSDFSIAKKISTGIYFYIAEDCEDGTEFLTTGKDATPDPLTWTSGTKPPMVTYGKFKNDAKAFSIQCYWEHATERSRAFDLNVKTPSGVIYNIAKIDEIDPTIVQRGEEPPDTRE